jgi:hypothetical protein
MTDACCRLACAPSASLEENQPSQAHYSANGRRCARGWHSTSQVTSARASRLLVRFKGARARR